MKKLKKIKIRINGKIRTIDDKSPLNQLINDLKIPISKVAIELNKEIINKNSTLFNIVQKNKIPLAKVAIELNQEIVDKKKIKNINLKNNDKIEIVHFIGGG